jgi:hypothetical protein
MQTAHRYSRLMQLNYQELGYVIKSIEPQDVSGQLMSEGLDRQSCMDFAVTNYKNLIKTIIKKLNLKINVVYWRRSMNQCSQMMETLAKAFPDLQFVNHQEDDTISCRNVVNTANLLANQYHFMASIWQWKFSECEAVKQRQELYGADSVQGLDRFLKIDPGYKSGAKYEQENWAYKYMDPVFGPPTIARTTMKNVRRMIR